MRVSSMIPPIRPGAQAHVRTIFPYTLPRGLAEGAEVTIESLDEGRCEVRDSAGERWTVPAVVLDMGSLVWQDGHWIPEEAA